MGTALQLFIDDLDPISVHALACGGSEIIEGMAETQNLPTLSTHIMNTFPELKHADVKRRRNLFWNAIKHFYGQNGKTARDDEALLKSFSDADNDAVLFMGWLDYMQLMKRLPLKRKFFRRGGMRPIPLD